MGGTRGHARSAEARPILRLLLRRRFASPRSPNSSPSIGGRWLGSLFAPQHPRGQDCDRPRFRGARILGLLGALIATLVATTAMAQPPTIVYPPPNHETTADRIFLIGTAPARDAVTINGTPVRRSKAGHFAPSFPLQIGSNTFSLKAGGTSLSLSVKRLPATPGDGLTALQPDRESLHLPGEWVCFGATAPKDATVTVTLGDRSLKLAPVGPTLPDNSAVLVDRPGSIEGTSQGAVKAPAQAPIVVDTVRGCTQFQAPTTLVPQFSMVRSASASQAGGAQAGAGQTITQAGAKLQILNANDIETIQVTADQGVARTGPSTDYSRLTPLPKGVRARVVGREGDWLELDYGGWIRRSETSSLAGLALPPSLIRSVAVRNQGDRTEVRFPLQMAVPIAIDQRGNHLALTLYNATAQTDTIRIGPNPIVSQLNWQQVRPGELRYDLTLKGQQWGYETRYDGSTLVLSLRHGPPLKSTSLKTSLKGIKIVLDPGHGGPEDSGARGPTGYPEKNVALKISQMLRQELVAKGATVVLTRETDVDLGLRERMDRIQAERPTLALSLHYNALPDQGDAIGTQGVAAFWYHDQAQGLAQSLHDSLVQGLNRPSYGVFWNNLALTRPTIAPTVMLELGFMINPDEFEWIIDPQAQARLVKVLADGIQTWLRQSA